MMKEELFERKENENDSKQQKIQFVLYNHDWTQCEESKHLLPAREYFHHHCPFHPVHKIVVVSIKHPQCLNLTYPDIEVVQIVKGTSTAGST